MLAVLGLRPARGSARLRGSLALRCARRSTLCVGDGAEVPPAGASEAPVLLSPPDGRALHYGTSRPRGTRQHTSPKDTLGYAYASGPMPNDSLTLIATLKRGMRSRTGPVTPVATSTPTQRLRCFEPTALVFTGTPDRTTHVTRLVQFAARRFLRLSPTYPDGLLGGRDARAKRREHFTRRPSNRCFSGRGFPKHQHPRPQNHKHHENSMKALHKIMMTTSSCQLQEPPEQT